uniref:Uncharacterized protein n=1 Tax=Helianthus annuus TaxID=4232 RepID=A0A251V1N3_HELAN
MLDATSDLIIDSSQPAFVDVVRHLRSCCLVPASATRYTRKIDLFLVLWRCTTMKDIKLLKTQHAVQVDYTTFIKKGIDHIFPKVWNHKGTPYVFQT